MIEMKKMKRVEKIIIKSKKIKKKMKGNKYSRR